MGEVIAMSAFYKGQLQEISYAAMKRREDLAEHKKCEAFQGVDSDLDVPVSFRKDMDEKTRQQIERDRSAVYGVMYHQNPGTSLESLLKTYHDAVGDDAEKDSVKVINNGANIKMSPCVAQVMRNAGYCVFRVAPQDICVPEKPGLEGLAV